MTAKLRRSSIPKKLAVVAVIVSENRLLVIRRSRFVVAPGQICFPGGGIEPGETAKEALTREIQEELGTDCQPDKEIWLSCTPWGTQVHWWTATLPRPMEISPNQREVSEYFWIPPDRLKVLPDLLISNAQFLTAWKQLKFEVPQLNRNSAAGDTAD
jgi:8-oxo-dGTP pyrophosphatase MutT (NUDIX family)